MCISQWRLVVLQNVLRETYFSVINQHTTDRILRIDYTMNPSDSRTYTHALYGDRWTVYTKSSWNCKWKGEERLIHTSLLLRPYSVWISLQATPMARRVSNHAINDVAAAAARLSVLHTRTWWAPANTEARPTMLATKANKRNVPVAVLPAQSP